MSRFYHSGRRRRLVLPRLNAEFTALYERRGKGIIATVAEIPGVNTQGRTMREARANLREALRLILETNGRLAVRYYASMIGELPPP